MSPQLALLFAAALLLAPIGARAGGLPDLVAEAADWEIELDTNVPPGDVAEGCAQATNGVDLIRFDAYSRNIGSVDLTIGDPGCPSNCNANPDVQCVNPEFHCSPAGGHNHAHFTNYARYELFVEGNPDAIRTGGKFGFCLEDTFCEVPGNEKFTCDFQGLTAGCEDLYSKFLGCQYIDVTGLVSGDYVLRVTVDPNERIDEADETNNVSEYPVTIEGTEEDDVALPGTAVEVKAKRGGGQRATFLAKAETAIELPSPPVAPTVDGATLTWNDVGGGGPSTVVLPASGWKGLGRPPGAKGYRFKGGKNAPCASVKITQDKVKADCSVPDFELPATGTGVSIELVVSAAKRYCALFGGTEEQNDAKKLRRENAPAACQLN